MTTPSTETPEQARRRRIRDAYKHAASGFPGCHGKGLRESFIAGAEAEARHKPAPMGGSSQSGSDRLTETRLRTAYEVGHQDGSEGNVNHWPGEPDWLLASLGAMEAEARHKPAPTPEPTPELPEGPTGGDARARACRRIVDEKLPAMREAARGVGYTLAIHGSLARDVDLIAVPWVEDAAPVEVLVDALAATFGAEGTDWGYSYRVGDPDPSTPRPHRRASWAINFVSAIGDAGAYIDLSVIEPGPPGALTYPLPEGYTDLGPTGGRIAYIVDDVTDVSISVWASGAVEIEGGPHPDAVLYTLARAGLLPGGEADMRDLAAMAAIRECRVASVEWLPKNDSGEDNWEVCLMGFQPTKKLHFGDDPADAILAALEGTPT